MGSLFRARGEQASDFVLKKLFFPTQTDYECSFAATGRPGSARGSNTKKRKVSWRCCFTERARMSKALCSYKVTG